MLALLVAASALADPGLRPTTEAELAWADDAAPPVGAWRAVAVPGLRACSSPEGPCPGAPLALGASVVVAEVGARTDDPRPGRWLRVAPAGEPAQATGWVRAQDLTRAAFQVDLDGDGATEAVALRFTDDRRVEAWVAASGLGLDAATAHRLDLGERRDIEGPQGRATATLLPASEAGIPLVRLRWHAREQCGSGDWFAYVSHWATPDAPARPRLALAHRGSGGDAPIWWETTARFSAEAATVTIHERAGEHQDDGSDSVHHDEVKTYQRVHGEYVEAPQ